MNIPIIQMGKTYPFASGSKSIQQCSEMLVHKELPFNNQKQKQMIEQLMHFVKSVSHSNLVNLVSTTEEPQAFHFYYQYIPLKLEPWILGVNEELADQIQDQLLELVQFLTRSSICFRFDPSSVGLSHNMTVKYFLNQFTLDAQNQDKNNQHLQQTIKKYIKQLRLEAGSTQKQSKSSRFCSVSTNGSVSHLQEFNNLSKSACNQNSSPKRQMEVNRLNKMQHLYQKVQNSKQKSMEVLLKLKSSAKNKL